jgi:hypothetical protein
MYGGLSVLPDQAQPLQRSALMAAVSVGSQIIQLRRICSRFDLSLGLDAALEAVAGGNCAMAPAELAILEPRSPPVRAQPCFGRAASFSRSLTRSPNMPFTSTQESLGVRRRSQPVWRLCRANFADDCRGLGQCIFAAVERRKSG